MASNHDPSEAAVVLKFLEQYAADRDADGVRSVDEYRARYPGFEDVISREFDVLQRGEFGATVTPIRVPQELERVLADERYTDADEVGRGGMGVVYRVWDGRLNRSLAMKVLGESAESPGTKPSSFGRFLDEAQTTGQLDHPGIVPVHDLGIDERGRAFFTMALIRGRDLREVIRSVHDAEDADWTLARALGVVLRVCEAVSFAHAKGVIHRDLKPANVMVGSFGETYVLDWGLARVVGRADVATSGAPTDTDEAPSRTLEGDVVGTPAYMSPEQARGTVDEVGPSTDVYSTGALLYHLLTNCIPYVADGERPSSSEIVRRVVAGPPRAVHEIRSGVPAELVAICEKAMQREPAARYATVAELADDLRAFLEVRVVGAYETGAIAEARKWIRRNRPLAWTGLAAVLALAAGLAFSLVQKQEAERQARLADDNFRIASEAVDRVLLRLGASDLRDVPHMEAVRRDVLLDALDYQRELLARRQDDPAARAAMARAFANVATIHGLLREEQEAIDAATEAGKRYDELLQESPDRTKWHVSVARMSGVRANSLKRIGDVAAAEAEFARGIERIRGSLERWPDHLNLVEAKCVLLNDVATIAIDAEDWERALPLIREAADSARRLAEQRAANRQLAVHALHNFAQVQLGLEQVDAAEPLLREALRVGEPASERDERSAGRRYALASVLGTLARLQLETGRGAESLVSWDRGTKLLRELVAEFPAVPRYRILLGDTLHNSARPVYEKDPDAAVEVLSSAIDEYEFVRATGGDPTVIRRKIRSTGRLRTSVLLELERLEDAERSIAHLATVNRIDAAIFLVRCGRMGTPEAREARFDRAVEWLTVQLEETPQMGPVLELDKLAPLRERTDFQELQQKMRDWAERNR